VSTTRRAPAHTARNPTAPASPGATATPAPADPGAPLATPTADAVWRYANATLEACWLVIAALVPLYLDLLRAQASLARGQALQVLAAFMALLWLIQWAAGRRSAAVRAGGPTPLPPLPTREGGEDGPPIPGGEGRGSAGAAMSYSALSTQHLALFVVLAAAYVGTTLLATVLSPLPAIAFWGSYLRGEGAVAVASYAVLFLVVADRLRHRAQLDRLVSVLLATSLPVCLYAVPQAMGHDPFGLQNTGGRAAATAGNAIFLAAYLGMLVPLTVWRLLDDPRRRGDVPRGSWLGPPGVAAAVVVVGAAFGAAIGRPQGWWAYPMLLAGFALVVAVLPPLPADALGQQVRRASYAALLALQLLVIVLTASRGPLAALLIALAVVGALCAWRGRRWRQLALVGALVVLASGGMLALMAPRSPLRPIADSVPLLQRLARVREDYTGARVLVWQRATEVLTAPTLMAPDGDALGGTRLLVGYGPESVVYLLNRVLPPPHELGNILGEFWDRTHNALLDRLLMTGLLGLAAYLALVLGVLVVALRRAWPTRAPFGWGLSFALAVALLSHLVESQTSMLALPPEAIFWLLAGVAVAVPGLERAPAVVVAAPPGAGRRDRRGAHGASAGLPTVPRAGVWPWPVVGYAAAAVLATLVMLQMPAPEALRAATVVELAAVLAAALVGALALAPAPAPGGAEAGGTTARALGAVALAGVVALAVSAHQVSALAAEVAFHRSELGQQSGNFPGAIRAAQQALALAPGQAEYYHILGQYYGALAGSTRAAPRPDFAPSLAAVRDEAAPEQLGRDQLFALGELSLNEATRLNPLEARYYSTLGELYRYWADVAGQPEHLAAAEASFARAAALKPNDVEIHAGLGDTLLLAGDAEGALAEGREATALLPDYWYGHDVVARAALALGDPTAALLAAGRALWNAGSTPAGVKAPTPYELDRLRQVLLDAVGTGATPVRPGALLRNDVSGSVYRIDEQGRARVLSPALAATCAAPPANVYPLPDTVLPNLPAGPALDAC